MHMNTHHSLKATNSLPLSQESWKALQELSVTARTSQNNSFSVHNSGRRASFYSLTRGHVLLCVCVWAFRVHTDSVSLLNNEWIQRVNIYIAEEHLRSLAKWIILMNLSIGHCTQFLQIWLKHPFGLKYELTGTQWSEATVTSQILFLAIT